MSSAKRRGVTKADGHASAGRAILLLAIAAFASAATTRICDALLPQLASEFQVTPGVAAIVVTAYSLTYGLMQPPFGALGDRLGKYRIILVCCVLSLLTTAACAMATTLNGLAIARLAAGFAAAAIVPLSLAWIGDTIAYAERQTTIARFMMGQVSGLIAGQAFGGWFGELYTAGARPSSSFSPSMSSRLLGLARELLRNPLTKLEDAATAPASFVAVFASALRRPHVQKSHRRDLSRRLLLFRRGRLHHDHAAPALRPELRPGGPDAGDLRPRRRDLRPVRAPHRAALRRRRRRADRGRTVSGFLPRPGLRAERAVDRARVPVRRRRLLPAAFRFAGERDAIDAAGARRGHVDVRDELLHRPGGRRRGRGADRRPFRRIARVPDLGRRIVDFWRSGSAPASRAAAKTKAEQRESSGAWPLAGYLSYRNVGGPFWAPLSVGANRRRPV